MADFLQLKGKIRIKGDGLLDMINKKNSDTQSDSETRENDLKEQVEAWLVKDGYLDDSPSIIKQIKPEQIGEVILRRMCDVSGHLWIEFVENLEDTGEDDLIKRGAGPLDPGINAHVIEFIPAGGEELFGSHSLDREQFGIDWSDVTDSYLLGLFSHLLNESDDRKQPPEKPRRSGAKALLRGRINLLSPSQIRQQQQAWFDDRKRAPTTPMWLVTEPAKVFRSFKEQEDRKAGNEKLSYSFTPEYYEATHNCVTWITFALQAGWKVDWVATIQDHCVPDPTALASKGCEDYDIEPRGRMGCVIEYIGAANKARQNGLRTFTV